MTDPFTQSLRRLMQRTIARGDGLPTMGEDYETQLENLMNDSPNPQTGSQVVNDDSAWILRMIGEADELDQRGRKLSRFINEDPKYKNLGLVEQYMLQNQQRYMAGYYGILLDRIRRAQDPEYAAAQDAEIAKGAEAPVGSGGTDGNG